MPQRGFREPPLALVCCPLGCLLPFPMAATSSCIKLILQLPRMKCVSVKWRWLSCRRLNYLGRSSALFTLWQFNMLSVLRISSQFRQYGSSHFCTLFDIGGQLSCIGFLSLRRKPINDFFSPRQILKM